MTKISGFIKTTVLVAILALVGLGWAADQKTTSDDTRAKSQPVSKIDLGLWQKPARPNTAGSPIQNVANLWLERYQGRAVPSSKAPLVQSQPTAPNAFVNVASPAPPADQNSATVSLSEFFPGEIYSAWTDPFGPGPGIPSGIGTSFSPALGIPGSWVPPPSGPIMPATAGPPAAFVRHPSMGSHPLGGHIVGYQGYGGGVGYLGGSAIWTDVTFGGGGPWGGFGPAPLVAMSLPAGCCTDYFDYPSTVIDDWPGTPSPPEFGAVFYTWTALADGDGDPNGDGNFFNDPADASFIAYEFSNTLGGPFPFPAFSAPLAVNIAGAPTLALQSDLAVVSPAGAGPLPPGALYVAWTDGYLIGAPPLVGPPPEGMSFLPTTVWIDASAAPGAGAPFGAIPGSAGGNVFISPVVPIGPVIGGGTQAQSTVTVGVNNATYPNPCGPGAVYVAWADGSLGDPDIFFSASFAGGSPGTWMPPVRVNQDPVANGLDQWAPSMAVDSLGNINIIFYDRRMDPGNVLTEVWMASSYDCGATWVDAPLSDGGPVPPASTIPPGYIGDYIDIDENAFNGAGSIWNDSRPAFASQEVWFENIKPTCTAKAGDANASGTFTLADPIAIVNYVFGKPGCIPVPTCWLSNLLCRGDWNGSGSVSLADVIRAVNYIFGAPGGPWLAIPIGQCCAPVP